MAIEVPGPTLAAGGVLEATFDPGCRLGEWDVQLLGHAAQLAALVLELERCRQQAVARPTAVAVRPKRDGAAPLIGSTAAMAVLREQDRTGRRSRISPSSWKARAASEKSSSRDRSTT